MKGQLSTPQPWSRSHSHRRPAPTRPTCSGSWCAFVRLLRPVPDRWAAAITAKCQDCGLPAWCKERISVAWFSHPFCFLSDFHSQSVCSIDVSVWAVQRTLPALACCLFVNVSCRSESVSREEESPGLLLLLARCGIASSSFVQRRSSEAMFGLLKGEVRCHGGNVCSSFEWKRCYSRQVETPPPHTSVDGPILLWQMHTFGGSTEQSAVNADCKFVSFTGGCDDVGMASSCWLIEKK